MQKQLFNLHNVAYFILLLCFALFLACSSSRNSEIGSNPVTVATFTGIVFDPPIVGAKVCCDVNENSECDSSEVYGTSLQSGEYSFTYNCSTSIVAEGGVDTITGIENTVLIADILDDSSYTSHLNPLTTLISKVPDENKDTVLSTILGDTDVDIFKDNFYDSCNNADDESDACNVLQTAMHVSALSNTLSSSLTSVSEKIAEVDVLEKMAESISEKIAEDPGDFNIIHADTVKEIFTLSIEKSKEIDTSFEITDEKMDAIASATVKIVDEIIAKDLSKMEENQSEYEEMFLIVDHIERLVLDEIDVDNFENISDDLSCLTDINLNGVCDSEESKGCTDETAYNYDETATVDDGTCEPIIQGCTNPLAWNYDSDANVDDSTCVVYGCINPAAQNYDETATDNDGTCIIVGCNDATALNFNPDVTNENNDLCEYNSNTAPVITLNGDSAIQVELGGTYTELGAVSNGGETVSINGTVNTSVLGEYQITYSAVNELSNTGTATRTVTVVDTTLPIISGITESTISITEGITQIGTLSANEDVVWSLTGTNASEFTIDSDGILSLNTASDYESIQEYTLTIKATDLSANESTFDLTINVSNINDNSPVFTSGTTFSIGLNQLGIGTVTATDADGDTLSYSITDDTSGLFSINSSTGYLSILQSPAGQTTFNIDVSVSDGSNYLSQTLIITVDNNNAPVISSTSFTVDENQTSVGTIAASDVDGDTLTYSISDGDDSGSFSIDSSSGVLVFNTAPDFESDSISYTIEILVSDGTNSQSQDISILVSNVNEAPVISSTSFTVDENQTSVGTLAATDPDSNTLTYSISGGDDSDSFSIDSSTGVLTFNSAPDYEVDATSYSITVSVTDGTLTDTQSLTIDVTNVNDNAPVISSTSFTVDENQTSVGTITASDADNDTLTYSIGGTDESSFSIDSSSGVLTFNTAPDYETQTSYSITITVSDGTNSDTETLTITITDLDEGTESTVGQTIDYRSLAKTYHGLDQSAAISDAQLITYFSQFFTTTSTVVSDSYLCSDEDNFKYNPNNGRVFYSNLNNYSYDSITVSYSHTIDGVTLSIDGDFLSIATNSMPHHQTPFYYNKSVDSDSDGVTQDESLSNDQCVFSMGNSIQDAMETI
ncbi:MAG: cadherin domain-containing protein, partial [Candidatus Margulisiibacteriota bacterium]|nr:cadherin domain-containing protein [Candidatus Margulisiibacteriota bacterium]